MKVRTIAEVAEATGFSRSALRFYERAGLVTPGRNDAGYRVYDDADVDRLEFIARGKRLGLTLEEIADVLPLLADDVCGPVQDRLRTFVADKIGDAERQVAEGTALLAQLRHVAGRLSSHTPAGPCDDACGCTSDPTDVPRTAATTFPVALITGRAGGHETPPIACTLDASSLDERLAEWAAVTGAALDREEIPGGVRLRLDRTTDLAALTELIAAEQSCCASFTFTLTVAPHGIAVDVVAPDDARAMVDALVGAPA